jgi:hypothetical protein
VQAGDFLSVAMQDGWETTGIEPSDRAKTIAIKKGISLWKTRTVYQTTLLML